MKRKWIAIYNINLQNYLGEYDIFPYNNYYYYLDEQLQKLMDRYTIERYLIPNKCGC
jgi:hypothetical protein